jgi:hypothetical protein
LITLLGYSTTVLQQEKKKNRRTQFTVEQAGLAGKAPIVINIDLQN